MVLCIGSAEQLTAFRLVRRAGNAHVGNTTCESNVVHACMRRAISAHDASTIQCKHHWQVLQCYIVNQLVVGALQESGIDGHHWLQTLACHACSKGHGVLFCNAHIVIALRILPAEIHHARAFTHGRRDAHQALVFCSHVAQPLAKYLGECGLGWRCRGNADNADSRIKFARAVIGHWIGFGLCIALAFARHHMQKLRAGFVVQTLQSVNQVI